MEEMTLEKARETFQSWLKYVKEHKEDVREVKEIMGAITAMLKATEGVNKDGV